MEIKFVAKALIDNKSVLACLVSSHNLNQWWYILLDEDSMS